jgi:hypothetical protein
VSKETWDVLHEDVAGSKVANGSDVFTPQAGPGSVDPGSLPGKAEVLAGESSAEDIDGFDGAPIHGADVSVSRNGRPVLGEDALTVGVDFNLPTDGESGSFKSKVDPSYS